MRLTRHLLIAVLALLLVPLGAAPAQAAEGTITGVALDSSGKPLPHLNWELYTWEGGQWTTLQFGPKITDRQGRFTYRSTVGSKYRVCFYDTYYGGVTSEHDFWQPEIRHRDTCWPNATSMGSATTWTATSSAPSRTFTVTLPKQALGMAPVDPFIVGSYQVGEPLTIVGQEGWQPTGATFTYQWMSHAEGSAVKAIPGATKATFTPTSAQRNTWVFARVTASRAGYKPASLTTPTTMVGTEHVEPSSALRISGTAKPGATLTASFGKPANTYSQLAWFVDGVPVGGITHDSATSALKVTSAHSGAKIEVRLKLYKTSAEGHYVDGSDTYRRVQVQASGTRPVKALPVAPKPAGQPTVGKILKARTVTADPNAKVDHQWIRGTKAIKGATKNRYKVKRADLNKKIKVRTTVTRPGWRNTYVTTSTATVAKKALKKGTVKIAGKARVGKKLTARTAKWRPKSVKLRYHWLRNGKVIRGANKATYKVKKADRGKVLKVRVTAKKKNYLTVTKKSKGKRVKR